MKYMFPGKWQGPLSLNKVQFLFSTVGTNSDLSPVHNYCDWCIGYRWNKDKLFGDTNKLPTKIFIYQNSFKFFYNKIYPLIPKNHKYLIIIGDDDLTIPINYDERWNKDELMTLEMWEDITNNPQIKHIFATKLSIKQTNKYSPLHVGFNPAEFKNFSPDNLLDFKVNLDIRNKLLKVLYASRVRMHKERILIKNLCENSWSDFCDVKSNIDKNNFNDFIQNYSFMICDTGDDKNHIDPNPKLFTCLYLGVIPIIKKFVNCYEMYCDLPIMYIDDWDTNSISLEKLLHFRSKFEPYFYDSSKREKVLEKLSSEYWIKYIINKTNDKTLVE